MPLPQVSTRPSRFARSLPAWRRNWEPTTPEKRFERPRTTWQRNSRAWKAKSCSSSKQEAGSSDFPPTTQQVAVGEELKKQGDQFQQEYQQIVAKDVTAFNAMLREK